MLKITNLGHASFLFEDDNYSIITDPYLDNSVPNLKFPRISANKVLISHDHYDHCGKVLVTIIPSQNEIPIKEIIVPHDHHNGAKRGLNKMHLFKMDKYTILHTGDLGCIPDESVLKQLTNIDILLAPINGFYTISSKELKILMDLIKPKITIPMHYFKQINQSGYPDGGQIDSFRQLVPIYLEVNDFSINVSDELFVYDALIFNKELQEK